MPQDMQKKLEELQKQYQKVVEALNANMILKNKLEGAIEVTQDYINQSIKDKDKKQLAEIYAEYGTVAVVILLFVSQLFWMQNQLSKSLAEIKTILIKLIDRFNRSDEAYERWQDKIIENAERRHESVLKELNDVTDSMHYLKGRLNNKANH